jgi:hypothetical protein
MNGIRATALSALLLAAAVPASADWLVTKSSGRVETHGPWKIKGKLVVFTQADGSLASLRLADVDLNASEQVTAAANRIESQDLPMAEAPRKKLAVLTDETLVRARKEPAKADEAGGDKKDAAAKPAGTISVASWKRADRTDSGVEIQGTLQNNTDKIAANAGVDVQLFNEAGQQLASAPGILSTTSLQPRGTTEFRATFPDVFAYADVRFQTKGWPLDISPTPAQKPEGSAPQ